MRVPGIMGSGGQLGYLMLIELSSPFVSDAPSEGLIPIDVKELTHSAGLGRDLSSLDFTEAL